MLIVVLSMPGRLHDIYDITLLFILLNDLLQNETVYGTIFI